MAQETETPEKTLAAATQENALNTSGLALIGTFIKPDGNVALVRTSGGDVQRVATGDAISGATVLAVEPGILHIAQGGRTRRLRMPDG